MGRPCWICGASKSTREHVWPKWLRKIATSDVGTYRIGVTSDPGGWQVRTGTAFTHTSRVLCSDCNSRLSALEGRVALVLPRLVGGSAVRLTASEQELLAQWFYKTGLMVSTTMDHDAAALPKKHYTDLHQSLDLPPASAVWIGHLEQQAHEAALWVQRFEWQDRWLDNAPMGDGYMFAMSIADVAAAVAVLDVRQSPNSSDTNPFVQGGAAAGRLSRIWPVSEHYSVSWPPPLKLTAVQYQDLADSLQRIGSPVGD